MSDTALFIFRRDLRLTDNTALIKASLSHQKVIPIFIFDPRQIRAHAYKSAPGFNFMIESLRELSDEISALGGKLHFLEGLSHSVVAEILEDWLIKAVYVNRDYTPFSINRDEEIKSICENKGVKFFSFDDSLLHSPEEAKKGDGNPYTVFTPFFKNAQKLSVPKPKKFQGESLFKGESSKKAPLLLDRFMFSDSSFASSKGGRKEGVSILKKLSNFGSYHSDRNFPSIPGTTKLSPHNKFGTVSIREVYHSIVDTLGQDSKLINEIFWRDFFTHIAFHFPHVFKGAFYKKYDDIEWNEPNADFERWKEGTTGFPIVDAGMRELVTSGWMHNRVRMITASFLTKDLHISWQEGERFFANNLVDYDPSVNNGNWQWASSTGCDSQPYFRIFNPWIQQKKFDPECEYIKRWIPELRELTPKAIHALENSNFRPSSYPASIVDHGEASAGAKALFTNIT